MLVFVSNDFWRVRKKLNVAHVLNVMGSASVENILLRECLC